MARPELGTKRTDPETGQKFYDLGRDPIVSPYTGTSYPLSFFAAPASAPSRYTAAAARPVHREEDREEQAEEQDEEDTDTVSLNDLEEDEDGAAKPHAIDADDEEIEKDDADDAFLALDEEDDAGGVDEIVGEQDEDDKDR